MTNYIDAEKLIAEIQKRIEETKSMKPSFDQFWAGQISAFKGCLSIITSLQQKQPDNMIQWTGNNLKEVINFTGKSPKFDEWFKSWDEFESYVHSHGNILKLFSEDGSNFEVPVGAWIVKTPDGYNVPSVARFIHAKQEQSEENKLPSKRMRVNYAICNLQAFKPLREAIVLDDYVYDEGKCYRENLINYIHVIPESRLSEIRSYLKEKGWWPYEDDADWVEQEQEQPEVDLDFQVFAKEMDAVFNIPKEVTKNTEENPLNWEYAIARHFYELGLNARKKE